MSPLLDRISVGLVFQIYNRFIWRIESEIAIVIYIKNIKTIP